MELLSYFLTAWAVQRLLKSQSDRLTDWQIDKEHLALFNSVWLCMTMYDNVWLCMTMYDYVRPCLTMYDYVWLCMTMYDSVWLCMTLYDLAWLCMNMYDYIWIWMPLYDNNNNNMLFIFHVMSNKIKRTKRLQQHGLVESSTLPL